ncbi:hypothetical protein VNO78_34803 [Psophocarpus tetragonolobus]|uniref:F-box domain-containing protein n=1 Tax=Psophocarpus tetragonolobus TaxID=3891 RepID=A0AAN9RM87_PSOTE
MEVTIVMTDYDYDVTCDGKTELVGMLFQFSYGINFSLYMWQEQIGVVMNLPEECIVHILSYTIDTPVDAVRLSLVSEAFRLATRSDTVWDRFIPSDLSSIIPPSSLPSSSCGSKKDLYLALCDHPIIIDQGTKSFHLDKRTGKKCYMLSAGHLLIESGGEFQPVVALNPPSQASFDISESTNTLALSPNTKYTAFLVFKIIGASGSDEYQLKVCRCSTRETFSLLAGRRNATCCLEMSLESYGLLEQKFYVRSDGWKEIEIKHFFDSALQSYQDIQVLIQVTHATTHRLRQVLVLEGIEVRPYS